MTLLLTEIKAPNSILKTLYVPFTSTTPSLILAKINRVEVYDVTPEGLVLTHTLPLYDRVATLASFVPPLCQRHWLVVITESDRLFVVAFDGAAFVTMEDIQFNRAGSQVSLDSSALVAIDPQHAFIVVHSVQGYVQTVPVNLRYPKRFMEVEAPVREKKRPRVVAYERLFKPTVVSALGGVTVQHMCVMRTSTTAFLVVAVRDANLNHFVRFYEQSPGHGFSLVRQTQTLAAEVTAMVALSTGVLVFTAHDQFIFALPEKALTSIDTSVETLKGPSAALVRHLSTPLDIITATLLDQGRVMCCTASGAVSILHLRFKALELQTWTVSLLGNVTIANDLIHLNNGIFFAPSQLSRSVLFRVLPTAPHIAILMFLPSSPPVLDASIETWGPCLTLNVCQGGLTLGEVVRLLRHTVAKTVLLLFSSFGQYQQVWAFPWNGGHAVIAQGLEEWVGFHLVVSEGTYALTAVEPSALEPGLSGSETLLDVSAEGKFLTSTGESFGRIVDDSRVVLTEEGVAVDGCLVHSIAAGSVSAFAAGLVEGRMVVVLGLWEGEVKVLTETSGVFVTTTLACTEAVTSVLLREGRVVVGCETGTLHVVDLKAPGIRNTFRFLFNGPVRLSELGNRVGVLTGSGTFVLPCNLAEPLEAESLDCNASTVCWLTDNVSLMCEGRVLVVMTIPTLKSSPVTKTAFFPSELVRKRVPLADGLAVVLTQKGTHSRLKLLQTVDLKVLDTFHLPKGVEGTDMCTTEAGVEADEPAPVGLERLLRLGFMLTTNGDSHSMRFFAVRERKLVLLCTSEAEVSGGLLEVVVHTVVNAGAGLFLVGGSVTLGFQLAYDSDQDAFFLLQITNNKPIPHFCLALRAEAGTVFAASVLNEMFQLTFLTNETKTAELRARHPWAGHRLRYRTLSLKRIPAPHQNFLTAMEVLPDAFLTGDAVGNLVMLHRTSLEVMAMVNVGDQINTLSLIKGIQPSLANALGAVPIAVVCTVNGGIYLLHRATVEDYEAVMHLAVATVGQTPRLGGSTIAAYAAYRSIELRDGSLIEPSNFLETAMLERAQTDRCMALVRDCFPY